MRAEYILAIKLLLCVKLSATSRSDVFKLTRDNFEEKVKEKKCMILYGTNDKCRKCSLLYNKFVTVSQTFADNADVIFGQFTDKTLADKFGVDTFPAIVFYEFGSSVPRTYIGDMTTAAINKLVTKAMKGDFRTNDKKFAVQLTKTNFNDIIKIDRQYRLVMLHRNDDEDEIDDFDDLAETFDNDFKIVFARINVEVEKDVGKQYKATYYPTFYWYEIGNLEKKRRYNGDLDIELMLSFINQQTGLHRMKNGRLSAFAGLIPQLDNVLHKNGKSLYEVGKIDKVKTALKVAIKKLPQGIDKHMTDYYLHLLDKLKEGGTVEVLGESRSRLHKDMKGASSLQKDELRRKLNILQKVIDIIGKYVLADVSNSEVDDVDMYDNVEAKGSSEHGIVFHDEL